MGTRIIDLIITLKNSCYCKEESIREEFSLSPAEYRGLLAAAPGETVSGGVLSRKMGLSISRGSRVIDKLVKKGYVKFSDDIKDRRYLRVQLTANGLKVRSKINMLLDECEREIKSKIPKSELKSFLNSLDKLTLILNSN